MNIKNYILNLKHRFSKTDTSVIRKNLNFDDVKKIGVLIYNPDREFNTDINLFIKQLVSEGKSVEALCFTSTTNSIHFDFPCSYYSLEDVDWKGQFKREGINKFIKTEFDYLYSINILPFLPFKIVLKKSKAKFRIGNFEENADLDLMIKTDSNLTIRTLLEQINFYSKKLKSNE
jgi:hypothetical protein